MAGVYNLTIEQGATLDLALTWKDAAGTPINLTGYTARLQVRPSIDSATTLLTMTTENGRISLGGAAGTIRLLLDAATTASLTWTSGVYDLELQSAGGTVTRLLAGTVTVSPEVTR